MRSAFLATIVILNISGFIDRTKAAGCEDVGIWILDGLVSCDKLVTPSMWGVHTKQEYHCLSDTFTECCATCKELGHVRPGTGNGGSNTQPTAAPPRTERPTETPAPTIKPVQPVDTCKDEQIWIADSSVDCKYLLRDSHWGVNQNAAWRCANDRNTKCCKTCKQIDTSGAVITAASTKAPSSGTTKTASNGGCVDKHIWVMDMDFDCSLLESPSQYGFHNRAEYYCTLHPVTDCCATCTKLGYVESTTTSTTTPTTTTTTQKPVTKKPVTSKYLPSFRMPVFCFDIGVFSPPFGYVSCKHLEKKTSYALYKNAVDFCRSPSKMMCCRTCSRILGNSNTYLSIFQIIGNKIQDFNKQKMSNQIM